MQAQNTQHTAAPQQSEVVEVDVISWLTSHTVMLAVLIAVGWWLRHLAVQGADFPLQGGALAYQLARAVQASAFAPPWEVAAPYGGEPFPFTYPPLGIYAAVAIENWLGTPLQTLFRAFPAAASTLVLPLFYRLCWTMLRTKALSFTATLAFALMPAPVEWMVAGQGVVRVTGLLLALLALHQSYRLIVGRSENHLFPASLFAVLAFLVHAEMGYFVLYSVLVMLLLRGRNRYSGLNTLLMLVIVLMLGALWLVPVAIAHGVLPFAGAAAGVYLPPNPLRHFAGQVPITGEPFIPVIFTLGLLGFFVALAKRRFFLPAWLVTIWLLHPRSADVLMLLPLAMLAAVAVHQLVLPLIVQTSQASYGGGFPALRYAGQSWVRGINRRLYQLPIVLFIGGLLAYTGAGAVRAVQAFDPPLPLIEHETMEWIAANPDIPPDARFLVITNTAEWQVDAAEMWFPVLAQRESVLTVQHAGWRYNVFQTRAFRERLHACVDRDIACLLDLEADIAAARGYELQTEGSLESAITRARATTGTVDVVAASPRVFDYVYISPAVRGKLIEYFAGAPENYLPLRREGGADVYQRLVTQEDAGEP